MFDGLQRQQVQSGSIDRSSGRGSQQMLVRTCSKVSPEQAATN